MLIVGPRFTMMPLPRSSAPTTCPYRLASDASQLAASDAPAGSWVTPLRPSPTPFGPSARDSAGMHRPGTAVVVTAPSARPVAPVPASMSILSARGIRGSSMLTRLLTDSDWSSHGQDGPAAWRGAVAAGAMLAAIGSATATSPAGRASRSRRRLVSRPTGLPAKRNKSLKHDLRYPDHD